MIRTIIIDENKQERSILYNHLTKFCKEVKIEAEAENVNDALEAICKYHPDLIFLDIKSKNSTSFTLLNRLKKITFKIICVTSNKKYALNAFGYGASYFLLKPFDVKELIHAIEKVKEELSLKPDWQNLSILTDIINHQEKKPETIVIPDIKGFKIVLQKSIIKCKADGTCTYFYLTDNSIVMSTKNLGYYNYLLNNENFMQTHKSCYINLIHVKEYIRSEQTIKLSCNITAPVGDKYRKNFLQVFMKK